LTATDSITGQDLTIGVTDSEGRALVCLGGRVTIDSSPDLRKQLHALLDQPCPPALIIDLSELSYIDCSGIGTLIEALRIARQRHSNLELQGLRDRPRHLLEVTGLLRLFDTNRGTDHSSVSKVS
jgi:anti-sigma B factor antagonist